MKQRLYRFFFAAFLISINISFALAQPRLKLPDLASAEIEQTPNGWNFFVKAHKALQGEENPIAWSEKPEEAAQKLSAQRAYLAQNAEALHLIKEGLRYAAHRPLDSDLDNGSGISKLGRLLTCKAQVAAADKQWDEARNALLDVIRLGVVSARGGTFIAYLSGFIMQNGAQSELKRLMPSLSAEQLRETSKILEALYAARLTYSEAIEAETWFGLSQMQDFFTSREWQNYRKNQRPLNDVFENATPEQIAFLQKRGERQNAIAYLKAMDDYIEKSRVLYPQQPDFDATNLDAMSALVSSSITSKIGRLAFARNDARLTLCLAQIALQGYFFEKGAYPATLQELTPNFLTRVPLDPFDAQNLRYHRTEKSYLLYSVGPDGIDNNGAPIDNKPPLIKDNDDRARRQILPESSGDMVADINK